MTKSTFGEHLKREREMRGVSLEEISAATRIGTRFLAALENEQWERLPGGVFNRGFVRTIARFLGLDEESMVAEYALATGDRGDAANWGTTKTAPPVAEPARWVALLVLFAIVVLLGIGGWFGWRKFSAWRAARHAVAAAASAASTVSPDQRPVTDPTAPIATPSAGGQGAGVASPLSPSEPVTLELKVEAGKATTVRITADGKSVFSGRMAAGESQTFQAQAQYEVSARDSSAVLLELNGQTVPPLGPPGQPGKATLTRKDLRKPSGGPD